MKKSAFSLVELLVTLIIVSLVMSALAPVITKKLTANGIIVGGGFGGNSSGGDDEEEEEEEEEEPTYVTRSPMSQEDCEPYKAHYFNGACIARGNVGDEIRGGAPSDGISGITRLSPGDSCSTGSCCWKGTTSDGSGNTFFNSAYSGNTRTVCTWAAANAACAEYNPKRTDGLTKDKEGNELTTLGKWKLPTYDQLDKMAIQNNSNDLSGYSSKLSKYLGKRGLDLCDGHWQTKEKYGSAYCYQREWHCQASSNSANHCYPNRIWGEEDTSTASFYTSLSSGNMSTGSMTKNGGLSARCVLNEVYALDNLSTSKPKDLSNYETPSSQEDCDQYKAHYFDGTCITKVNAGDSAYITGPALGEGTITTGALSTYGIEVINSGTHCYSNTCCWKGKTTIYDDHENCSDFSPSKSAYGSCQRTVCTWGAAKIICDNYDVNDSKGLWRLPTHSDLTNWKSRNDSNDTDASTSKLSKYLGSDGIFLCDNHWEAVSKHGSPYCYSGQWYCQTAAGGAHCQAHSVWGQEDSTTTASKIALNSKSLSIASTGKTSSGGISVRCVLDKTKKRTATPTPEDTRTFKEPASQADCNKYNAFYFDKTCITKGNVGDVNHYGPPIDSNNQVTFDKITDYGIAVIRPGTNCTTNNCCWKGNTTMVDGGNNCSTYGITGSYDACSRTVCTWGAADTACKNYNANGDTKGLWELPTQAELTKWKNTIASDTNATTAKFTKYLGPNGMDLCDGHWQATSNYGSSYCYSGQWYCQTAAGGAHCQAHSVWGQEETATTGFTGYLNAGSFSVGTAHKTSGGGIGARCVLRKIPK